MKKIILFTITTLFFASGSFAVNVLENKLYIFEGEKRIKDNSVIVRYEAGDEYEVCGGGFVWVNGGFEKSQTLIFYKTDASLPAEIIDWWYSDEGDEDDLSGEKYQSYLKEKAGDAEYKIKIVLPKVSKETLFSRFEDAETEYRVFNVDLKSGKLENLAEDKV